MTRRNGLLVCASVLVMLLPLVLLSTAGPQDRAQVSAVALQPGPVLHTDYWVNSVAFAPDGRMLITAGGSMDQHTELIAWDAVRCEKRFVLAGHRRAVHTVAFSADGSVLASAGHDDTVRFWDPRSGASRGLLQMDGVVMMALSPDGRRIATTSLNKRVSLWEVATRKRLHTFAGFGRPAFLPDGRSLVVGDQNVFNRFDVETGQEIACWGPSAEAVFALNFSPDGRQLAVIGYSNPDVEVWDVASGRLARTLVGHNAGVAAIAFDPDGRILASGGLDRTIRIWDLASGLLLQARYAHSVRITALAFAPDGQSLVSAGYDKTIRFWRIVPTDCARSPKKVETHWADTFVGKSWRLTAKSAKWRRLLPRDIIVRNQESNLLTIIDLE